MGWKSKAIEFPIWLASRGVRSLKVMPEEPGSIFVLRCNDLGDLLVITALFQALRERFPRSHIVAGIGDWSREVLENNPYVDEILSVNMPRYNKFAKPQRTRDLLRFLGVSDTVREIAARKFDIGIDILGSYAGSALLMRTGIPYRLGVKGFIGGHSATQQAVEYNEFEHVGRSALRFAELLGAETVPAYRPQLFLTEGEREAGEQRWSAREASGTAHKRIVMGPGGGFAEKCWPLEYYTELLEKISAEYPVEVIVVGGKQDRSAGKRLAAVSESVKNCAGELSLRETFAVVAASDIVLCNSSMLMHVAGAFHKKTFVFLGEYFQSAAQHHSQWGYPETCTTLGKEEDRPAIYTPSEAFQCIFR